MKENFVAAIDWYFAVCVELPVYLLYYGTESP